MTRSLRWPVVAGILLLLTACAPSPSLSPTATPTPMPSVGASESPATSPSPSDEPSSQPSAAPSASQSETGFEITPNPDADALFLQREDCLNETDGYRLQMPASWSTNSPQGEADRCRRFAADGQDANVQANVAITIEVAQSGEMTVGEEADRTDGIIGRTQPAFRIESEAAGGVMVTTYVVLLGPSVDIGPNLIVRTSGEMAGDYALNVAVLDRMMATMELIGSIE